MKTVPHFSTATLRHFRPPFPILVANAHILARGSPRTDSIGIHPDEILEACSFGEMASTNFFFFITHCKAGKFSLI
jgi:hypothetical protein